MLPSSLPADLGREVHVPVQDRAWRLLGVSAFLVALAGAVFLVPDDGDPQVDVMRIVAAALAVFGVGLAGVGLAQLRHHPRALVLGLDTVTIPALPWWRAPHTVPWADLQHLGQRHLPNVGATLAFQRTDGTTLDVPYEAFDPAVLEAALPRIAARWNRARTGDPAELTGGWEAVRLTGPEAAAVVVDGAVVAVHPDVGAYTAARASHPPGHRLVLDRPTPTAALGLDAAALDRLLDLVAELGPGDVRAAGALDRRNLILFADHGNYELFSMLRAAGQAQDPAATVREHFARVAAALAESTALRSLAHDLDAVRHALRVHLDHGSRLAPHAVSRPIGGDIHAVLILDHSHGTTQVSRALATEWGVDDDALFAEALDRMRADDAPEREDRGAFVAQLGDETTAARVLIDVPDGAVVAVPARDVLLVMESALSLLVAGTMLHEAHAIHASTSRPVSPDLHVWWGSRLHPVEVRAGADGPVLVPPGDVFGEILAAQRN